MSASSSPGQGRRGLRSGRTRAEEREAASEDDGEAATAANGRSIKGSAPSSRNSSPNPRSRKSNGSSRASSRDSVKAGGSSSRRSARLRASVDVDEQDSKESSCKTNSSDNEELEEEVEEATSATAKGNGRHHQPLSNGSNSRSRRLRSRTISREKEGDGESGDADSELSEDEEENDADKVPQTKEEKSENKKQESQRSPKKGVSSTSSRRRSKGCGPSSEKMIEFRQAVSDNLRTLDDRVAKVIDEKNIECVCGKNVRLSTKFYWRYFLQKPTVKNGTVVQKGHWFNCDTVKHAGSLIPPHEVTQRELDESKVAFKEQQAKGKSREKKVVSNSDEESEEEEAAAAGRRLPKRRRRKVVNRDFGEPDEKKVRELLAANATASSSSSSTTTTTTSSAAFNMEKHIRELQSTRVPGETFLQDGPCFQTSPDVVMCHMCRSTSYSERKEILSQGRFDEENSDVSCCFYAFRKLVVEEEGGPVRVAGYLDPVRDPKEEDLRLWRPDASTAPSISPEMVNYTLGLIGDQFCDIVQQERQHVALHGAAGRGAAPVWKPPVRGVREMCDVCQTTLFNTHWTCASCGIVVCLDCFQFRRTGMVRENKRVRGAATDEYDWPMCNSGRSHSVDMLMLAQIIPGTALVEMSQRMHEARQRLGMQQFCHRKEDIVTLFTEEGVRY